MNSQFSLALDLLLMAVAASSFLHIRMGILWSWGALVQSAILLGIIYAGLNIGPDWLYAILGWVIFLGMAYLQRTSLNGINAYLLQLKPEAALKNANFLRFFMWGKAGRFWQDMCQAMLYLSQAKLDKADQVFAFWNKQKLPKVIREALISYMMLGRNIVRDWQGIIRDYEFAKANRAGQEGLSPSLAIAASRAYAEMGNLPESVSSLELADFGPMRFQKADLVRIFLPIYCLAGSDQDVESLFDTQDKNGLPVYNKLYWLSRLELAKGNVEEARAKLESSLSMARQEAPNWVGRINSQLELLNEEVAVKELASGSKLASAQLDDTLLRARQLWIKLATAPEVITPSTTGLLVKAMLVVLLLCYFLSIVYLLYPCAATLQISAPILVFGTLRPNLAMHGEYWRFFTYLLLHAHVTHLLLNIIGLWFFGRMCDKIFGPVNLLIIFVIAGVVSGMAQAWLVPNLDAVGASGGVMGIFGAVAAGVFRLKKVLPESIRQRELTMMGFLVFLQIVIDQILPHVAAYAHAGGLFCGFLLGLVLPLRKL